VRPVAAVSKAGRTNIRVIYCTDASRDQIVSPTKTARNGRICSL
jgi:hypothetical protein